MKSYEYGPFDTFTWVKERFRKSIIHRCLECNYHNFDHEAQALEHMRRFCHGLEKNGLMKPEDYIQEHRGQLDVMITLGYLCWNTAQISMEGTQALLAEASRLREMRCRVNIVILDNGSQDDTYWKIREILPYRDDSIVLLRAKDNVGISRGRNWIIDVAVGLGSDYLMMMDGDIEIVPLSSYVMARYLECHKDLGCIGAYSSSYTKDRDGATKHLYEIPEKRVKNDIKVAWTQYGLFRVKMFESGMRFEHSGPFGQPGWGFEDDDLCFQMMEKGYGNSYFGGMVYLHRNIRSSWISLSKSGINVESMFKMRKEFLVNKWLPRMGNPSILKLVNAQTLPRQ